MKSLTLFNNKGGVGKTTLTYHLAHMLSRIGLRVVALDYDPQCNLTFGMLGKRMFALWDRPTEDCAHAAACLEPVRQGRGLLRPPQLAEVADRLWLLPGHLDLSRFEQTLAEQWPRVMATDNERALDVVLSLSALAHRAAESVAADLVLLDVGPSLGAINHSAMLACDNVVVPMAWDWFSLQALLNIGPSIKEWRDDWQTVRERFLRSHPYAAFATHRFQPIGYVLQQRINQPDMDSIGYEAIGENVQRVFRTHLLQKGRLQDGAATDPDEHRLAMVDHYAALAPLSQLFCKPMFDLTQADGAVGGQVRMVRECRRTIEALARKICRRMDIPLPLPPP